MNSLCEKSYMEPLKKVVKRYKDIRAVNIVIRRYNERLAMLKMGIDWIIRMNQTSFCPL